MKRDIKKGLEFFGLNEKEYKILELLKAGNSWRPVDIARKTGISRTTINFLLKKFEIEVF